MIIFIRKNWLLILSLLYILSPIDFLPEFILGPLGIIDDIGVVIMLLAIAFFKHTRRPKAEISG